MLLLLFLVLLISYNPVPQEKYKSCISTEESRGASSLQVPSASSNDQWFVSAKSFGSCLGISCVTSQEIGT